LNEGTRDSLRAVGGLFVIIGLFLLAGGVYGLTMVTPCPFTGCPSKAIYWDGVYAGTALIITGAGMIIASLVM
jgi:hypothetical protein